MIRVIMVSLCFVGALVLLNTYWPQAWTLGFHIPDFLIAKVDGTTRVSMQTFTFRYAWIVLLPIAYYGIFKMKFSK